MLVTLIWSKNIFFILHLHKTFYSNIGFSIKFIIQIKLFNIDSSIVKNILTVCYYLLLFKHNKKTSIFHNSTYVL